MTSVIESLIGNINGVNRVFATPAEFVSGSIRAIVNGVVYETTDATYGLTEIDTENIRLATAPPTGASVQGFYVEAESTGSPFDPTGGFP